MTSEQRYLSGLSAQASASQTSAQHAMQQPGSVVWFISFGDLLTLLVCFFFVLTPWDRLKPGANNKSSQALETESRGESHSVEQGGISLATHSLKDLAKDSVVLLAEVPIPDCETGDVVCDSEFPALLANVGTENKEIGSTSEHTVVIRLCAEAGQKQQMLERIGRVLTGSHDSVADSWVANSPVAEKDMQVRVELLGGECGEIHVLAPYVGKAIGSVRLISARLT